MKGLPEEKRKGNSRDKKRPQEGLHEGQENITRKGHREEQEGSKKGLKKILYDG